MTAVGMKKWCDENGVTEVFSEPEWVKRRSNFNDLIEQGKHPSVILGDMCKGRELWVLMLAMVLVEDRGMTLSQLPQPLRGRYYQSVFAYLMHAGDGTRALPIRPETTSIRERRRSMSAAIA